MSQQVTKTRAKARTFVRNNKKYKIKAIRNSKVYAKEAVGQLLSIYYLVFWKCYIEEKSTWELALAIIHLCKIISTFHKEHSEQFIVILLLKDSAPPMAKPIAKLAVKSLNAYTKRKHEKTSKLSFK